MRAGSGDPAATTASQPALSCVAASVQTIYFNSYLPLQTRIQLAEVPHGDRFPTPSETLSARAVFESKIMRLRMTADTLVEARWVIPVIPRNTVLENHTVVFSGGRIADILPTEAARVRYAGLEAKTVRLPAGVVMPGPRQPSHARGHEPASRQGRRPSPHGLAHQGDLAGRGTPHECGIRARRQPDRGRRDDPLGRHLLLGPLLLPRRRRRGPSRSGAALRDCRHRHRLSVRLGPRTTTSTSASARRSSNATAATRSCA